jgi:hypothetical protein
VSAILVSVNAVFFITLESLERFSKASEKKNTNRAQVSLVHNWYMKNTTFTLSARCIDTEAYSITQTYLL